MTDSGDNSTANAWAAADSDMAPGATAVVPAAIYAQAVSENESLKVQLQALLKERDTLLGALNEARSHSNGTFKQAHDALAAAGEVMMQSNTKLAESNAELKSRVDDLTSELDDIRLDLRSNMETLEQLDYLFHNQKEVIKEQKKVISTLVAADVAAKVSRSRSIIKTVKYALEDMAVCLAAKIPLAAFEAADCSGIDNLEYARRDYQRSISLFVMNAVGTIGAVSPAVDAAIRSALQQLLASGIVDPIVWDGVAAEVAADVGRLDAIVRAAIDASPRTLGQLFTEPVLKDARAILQAHVTSDVAAAIAHAAQMVSYASGFSFEELAAEDLQAHAVKAQADTDETRALIAAFRQMYGEYQGMVAGLDLRATAQC